MSINSRRKGKTGELELAKLLREHGVDAWRGVQYQGGNESPDVVSSLPGVHLECKRVEAGNPYDWLDQAIADAGNNLPVVAHRRNRRAWIAVMRLGDLINLLKARGETNV